MSIKTKTVSNLDLKDKKLSTFSAVFIPVILTLISVVLFLRMGWIVAVGGIFTSFIVITLATLISFITALSISSVATNMRIGQGGLYFILARTFGIEVSSAISIPLFLAQSLGIAFYIMGFTEAISYIFPIFASKLTSLTILCILTFIASISAKSVLKAQLFIFIIVIFGLISLLCGQGFKDIEASSTTLVIPKLSFWVIFAIFFPSVTGIEGGLTLSKDLKNPSKSLPKGLLLGIGVAYLIYVIVAYFLNIHASQAALFTNPIIMKSLALVPQVIVAAICLSTLSGALSMLLTAPKMLGALAEDNVIPSIFGKNYGRSKLPKVAIFTSFLISLAGLSIGGMNNLAPVLTMIFLISYAMINSATALEAMIANPSWRPTFKVPWFLSFGGALLCMVVMLMINAGVTLFGLLIVLALYFGMKKRQLSTKWEDLRHSLLMFLARFATYRLSKIKTSAKTWRPNFLVFVGDPLLRSHLIGLTSAFTHKKGFLTMTSIVDFEHSPAYEIVEEKKLSLFLENAQIPAIVNTYRSKDLLSGMVRMIEHFGIGALSPNTIVLGATRKKEKYPLFAKVIKTAFQRKKNVLIINEPLSKNHLVKKYRNLDVWWAGGSKNNPELMLTLAYMLQNSMECKGSKLNLKTAVSIETDIALAKKKLQDLAISARLEIETEIVKHDLKQDIFQDTIKTSSEKSDLIFLGLRPPRDDETPEEYAKYYENLLNSTHNFPTTIFVLCGEDLEFSNILN